MRFDYYLDIFVILLFLTTVLRNILHSYLLQLRTIIKIAGGNIG